MAVSVPGKYYGLFQQAAQQYGVPIELLLGVAHTESRFNPNARSPVGAAGMMQFMPATAKQYGINPWDPAQAIPAAAKYLSREYKHFGDWGKAVTAYHSGRGNVERGTLGKYGRAYGPAVFKAAGMEFKPFYSEPAPVSSGSSSPIEAPMPQTTEPSVVPIQPKEQPTYIGNNFSMSTNLTAKLMAGLFNNMPYVPKTAKQAFNLAFGL